MDFMRSMPNSPISDRKVLQVGNPVLRRKAKLVPPDRIALQKSQDAASELVRVMRGPRLIGREKGGALAAPQLGTPSRVVVFEDPPGEVSELPAEQRKLEGREAPFGPKLIFNPRLRPLSDETAVLWERSVSLPAYRALVERHTSVQVTGVDPNGREVDYVATGWEARLAQQAVDVLDGNFFIDKCIIRSLRHLDARSDPLPADCPPLGPSSGAQRAPALSQEQLEAAAQQGGSRGFFSFLPGVAQSSVLLVGSLLLRLAAKAVPEEDLASQRVASAVKELREALASGSHPLGIAAHQLGHPLRIIAVGETQEQVDKLSARSRVTEEHSVFGPLVLINPEVRPCETASDAYFFERSASVPGYEAVVGRSLEVDVSALTERGERVTFTAKGWQARMIQHAADVLDGVLYVDRMERRSFRRDTLEEELPEGVPFGVRPRVAAAAARRAAAAAKPPSAGARAPAAAPPARGRVGAGRSRP